MRIIVIAALAAALASAAQAETPASAPAAAAKPPSNLIEALQAAGLDPRTKVEGASVQVMQGQRAIFHLDAAGKPVMNGVDAGRIGLATADGKGETYKGPGAGKLAFALDSSPEKRQSIMKVWNGLARPVAYEIEITAVRQGKLMKRLATICTVPAGGATHEAWPDPIVSVTLSKFAETPADKFTCQ
ncbi:MAG: hypothetical protein V4514_06525 [Pseudomonadota bacterium]|uniref:hypothetical protein n=1 Tax=Phenylobacterium sp. TaxID=1871053 RepID=UPI0025DD8C5D|nr:hypothetical protein [Phenylobacterium sp.]MBT9470412.1 hypothetical protein [Phenylobacterium sp.]